MKKRHSEHPTITINGRRIGRDYPPYVVAEISANHNGNLQHMLNTIKSAHDFGADAVKIQTYTPDTMTLDLDDPQFVVQEGKWKGRKLYELYKEAHTPYEWHEEIFAFAKEHDITLFSTPFDNTAIELLEALETPAYKVASFELTDVALIDKIGKTQKPVIISTGMGNLYEVDEAIGTYLNNFKPNDIISVALLHCISAYPSAIKDANLARMVNLETSFNTVVGLSDHSLSNDVALMAVALGASIIEKHYTLHRSWGGPDAEFSLEPIEFEKLKVKSTQAWEAVHGKGLVLPSDAERSSMQFRRSLYAVKPILFGEAFTTQNVRAIRPGYGLPPSHFQRVLRHIAPRDIQPGEPIVDELLG